MLRELFDFSLSVIDFYVKFTIEKQEKEGKIRK